MDLAGLVRPCPFSAMIPTVIEHKKQYYDQMLKGWRSQYTYCIFIFGNVKQFYSGFFF